MMQQIAGVDLLLGKKHLVIFTAFGRQYSFIVLYLRLRVEGIDI
jgi:hypothetical protein